MAVTYKFADTTGAGTSGSKGAPVSIVTALKDATNTNIPSGATVWVRGDPTGGRSKVYSDFTYNYEAGGPMLITTKGTPGAPTVIRAYPGERVIFNAPAGGVKVPALYHSGCDWLWFWDIEFETNDTEERCTTNGTDTGTGINRRTGPNPSGTATTGVRYINCEFRDFCNGPGFQSMIDSEQMLYGCIIYACGWLGSDDGHGHGHYHQNKKGMFNIHDCISCFNYGNGLQVYGSSNATVQNFDINGNMNFCNGELTSGFATPVPTVSAGGSGYANGPFVVTSSNGWAGTATAVGGVVQNTIVTTNYGTTFTDTPQSINFTAGGGSGATGTVVSAVYVKGQYVFGQGDGSPAVRHGGAQFSDNKAYFWDFANPRSMGSGSQIGYQLGWDGLVFERNYMYAGYHATFGMPVSVLFDDVSPARNGNQPNLVCNDNDFFKNASDGARAIPTGSPANRNSTTKPVTNKIFVKKNRYQRGRGHIYLYNWAASGSPITVTVNGSGGQDDIGLVDGQTYAIYKATNMPAGPITTGTYSSAAGTISVPHTSTAIYRPLGYNGPMPSGTGTEFGCYVVKPTNQLETPN